MEYPKELHRAETHIYLSREEFLMDNVKLYILRCYSRLMNEMNQF